MENHFGVGVHHQRVTSVNLHFQPWNAQNPLMLTSSDALDLAAWLVVHAEDNAQNNGGESVAGCALDQRDTAIASDVIVELQRRIAEVRAVLEVVDV